MTSIRGCRMISFYITRNHALGLLSLCGESYLRWSARRPYQSSYSCDNSKWEDLHSRCLLFTGPRSKQKVISPESESRLSLVFVQRGQLPSSRPFKHLNNFATIPFTRSSTRCTHSDNLNNLTISTTATYSFYCTFGLGRHRAKISNSCRTLPLLVGSTADTLKHHAGVNRSAAWIKSKASWT